MIRHRGAAITLIALAFTLLVPQPAEAGFFREVAFYLPNRLLDVVDIVRLRARVGPGVAAGLHATEAGDLFIGAYGGVYVGLPGPRKRQAPRLPFGLESRSGVSLGPLSAATGMGVEPEYGLMEIGASLQALLIGFDVGVDAYEILDLGLGFLTIDLVEDDL